MAQLETLLSRGQGTVQRSLDTEGGTGTPQRVAGIIQDGGIEPGSRHAETRLGQFIGKKQLAALGLRGSHEQIELAEQPLLARRAGAVPECPFQGDAGEEDEQRQDGRRRE